MLSIHDFYKAKIYNNILVVALETKLEHNNKNNKRASFFSFAVHLVIFVELCFVCVSSRPN